MAEIEIHHSSEHATDGFGKAVGVTVAVIGIVLAIITISSHRAHTAAVIYRTEANDQWSFYQSKKIREFEAENTVLLLKAAGSNQADVTAAIGKLSETRDRYAHETEEIQKEAKAKEHETEHAEAQALHFDLGEGLLELGLVLSSLYFLAKKRLFPYLGVSAAVAGAVIGTTGFFLG